MKKFVICDPEELYAKRLAEAFACRKELMFEVYYFTLPDQLLAFQKEHEIELLLADEAYADSCSREIKSAKIFLLTEARGDEPGKIYKYQSADDIFAEITEVCLDEGKEYFRSWNKKTVKIIGIYSPIRRIGKTRFAMEWGRELAKNAAVLYLNLDVYEALGAKLSGGAGRNLTDLLYYAGLQEDRIGIRLGTIVNQYGSMDCVSPCRISLDLKSVSGKEWKSLIAQLLKNSFYEILILDIGECIQGFYEVLEECTDIYMPVIADEALAARTELFEEEVRVVGKEELLGKIHKIELNDSVYPLIKELSSIGGTS